MNPDAEFIRDLPEAATQILARLESSKRPLLVSHIRLDGDAIGSELALAHMLRDRGAQPHAVNDSAIPRTYTFLPGTDTVGTSPSTLRKDYDLAVLLDIPTWDRAGAVRDALPSDLPVISIDHHPRIEETGELNWRDAAMSSVGEMLYRLARSGGWRISADAATCLYTAIITDTGRFTFPNTTPSALRAAADLIELGADHVGIAECLYQQDSPGLMALQAEAVRGLALHVGGKVGVMKLTEEMFRRTGVDPIDTQELAALPRTVAGVVVGVLLREMPGGKVKVSLRSRSSVNIASAARKFGGGGHAAAAGCEISGDLAAAERTVVQELTALLNQSEHSGRG